MGVWSPPSSPSSLRSSCLPSSQRAIAAPGPDVTHALHRLPCCPHRSTPPNPRLLGSSGNSIRSPRKLQAHGFPSVSATHVGEWRWCLGRASGPHGPAQALGAGGGEERGCAQAVPWTLPPPGQWGAWWEEGVGAPPGGGPHGGTGRARKLRSPCSTPPPPPRPLEPLSEALSGHEGGGVCVGGGSHLSCDEALGPEEEQAGPALEEFLPRRGVSGPAGDT